MPTIRKNWFAGLTIVGMGSVLLAAWLGLFASVDRGLIDLATSVSQEVASSDVVIVEIDALSLRELGAWPLPRSLHGALIKNVDASGARMLFVDVDFSAHSSPHEDAALVAAVANARIPVILPAFWQPAHHGAAHVVLSEPFAELKSHTRLGLVNLIPGEDGLVREVPELPHTDGIDPVWKILNARAPHAAPLRIDFRVSPQSFRRVSYVDVARGKNLHELRDKIVLVGATAIELSDIVAVPVHRALPGVVIQALAYETSHREAVSLLPPIALATLVVMWWALCSLVLSRAPWRSVPKVALTLLAAAVLSVLTSFLSADLIVPIVPFLLTTLLCMTIMLLKSVDTEALQAWRARRQSRDRDRLLGSVVDASADAVFTLDAQAHITSANPATLALFGVSPVKLIGNPIPPALDDLTRQLSYVMNDPERLVREAQIQHASGHTTIVEIRASDVTWEEGRLVAVTLRDVTGQRNRMLELHLLARRDALTGLPNRVSLTEHLDGALAACGPGEQVTLLLLDLDGFKEVNDALGHNTGDMLMSELGERLRQLLDRDRHVARVGGDEFAIVLSGQYAAQAGELAQHVLLMVEEPIPVKGISLSVGTSVGIATYPKDGRNAEAVMKCADVALYVAKRNRTRVEFYDAGADTHSPRRVEMLAALRRAISAGELDLHYQPKLRLRDGHVSDAEALCRWNSPSFGQVSPVEFIPIAEASDLIKPLTQWTLQRALGDCRSWREQGADLSVAVNLSARLLQDAQLPQWLSQLFAEVGAEPSWLELEITESAIMVDPDRALRIVQALHELGVVLSIDDFGTGYSSLTYLRDLSVHRLKIDRAFVDGMITHDKDRLIVESTIALAHGLGLQAIGEGIETQQQFEALRAFGCEYGQGYFIARPMPSSALLSWYFERMRRQVTNGATGLQRKYGY